MLQAGLTQFSVKDVPGSQFPFSHNAFCALPNHDINNALLFLIRPLSILVHFLTLIITQKYSFNELRFKF